MWGLPDCAKSYVASGHPLLAVRSVLRTPPISRRATSVS